MAEKVARAFNIVKEKECYLITACGLPFLHITDIIAVTPIA
jgi:hypothetical protein